MIDDAETTFCFWYPTAASGDETSKCVSAFPLRQDSPRVLSHGRLFGAAGVRGPVLEGHKERAERYCIQLIREGSPSTLGRGCVVTPPGTHI